MLNSVEELQRRVSQLEALLHAAREEKAHLESDFMNIIDQLQLSGNRGVASLHNS